MKKFSLIISLLFLSIGLLGCQKSGNEEELDKEISKSTEKITVKPTIIGEIVQIEGERFLVESITEKLPDGRPDAIWFSTDEIESLKVGLTVSVWTNAIEDSYPQQANAEKIEINE
ncbi:DUF3221 domain-containing protein [Lysinibacillus sp. NPDC097214]|uniref:DUF3221 domain-containing protein n=1 Tax=Lysinibacillus sp. NPDC097214 TaxID=3390584 RepID=UPI003D024FB5